MGVSLVVQAGVVLALAYLAEPSSDPAAHTRVTIEHGLVALAFLVTAGGAFYLAARRIKRPRSEPGGPASVSARPRQSA